MPLDILKQGCNEFKCIELIFYNMQTYITYKNHINNYITTLQSAAYNWCNRSQKLWQLERLSPFTFHSTELSATNGDNIGVRPPADLTTRPLRPTRSLGLTPGDSPPPLVDWATPRLPKLVVLGESCLVKGRTRHHYRKQSLYNAHKPRSDSWSSLSNQKSEN